MKSKREKELEGQVLQVLEIVKRTNTYKFTSTCSTGDALKELMNIGAILGNNLPFQEPTIKQGKK